MPIRAINYRDDIFIVRLLRAGVISLVFTVPLSQRVLDRLGDAHRALAEASLWFLWAVLLMSILVPSSIALTALRLASPAHFATVLLIAATAGTDIGMAIVIALSVIVVALASSAETGSHFIQASAYGDERRFPLRCPRPHAAVILLAWSLWFAATAIGAILLAAGIIIGLALLAPAVAGFVFLPRRFHRYARRWLVQVPAGLVVHDYMVLTETAMFPRRVVDDVDAWSHSESGVDEPFDLSGGIRSTGIVIRLTGPETVILSPTKDHPGGRAFHVRSARVCPTRIARTLRLLTMPS